MLYNSQLTYGNGDVYLNNLNNIKIIIIHYKGNSSLHTELGKHWDFNYNKNKIILYNNKNTILNKELIFKYRGEFKPLNCRIIDKFKYSQNLSINLSYIDFWNTIEETYEDITLEYFKLKKTNIYKSPKRVIK